MLFSRFISENYAMELDLFRMLRSFKDGLTAWQFEIDFSWYEGDHCPRFEVMWVILNLKIFEFGIYNVHHADDEDELLNQGKAEGL